MILKHPSIITWAVPGHPGDVCLCWSWRLVPNFDFLLKASPMEADTYWNCREGYCSWMSVMLVRVCNSFILPVLTHLHRRLPLVPRHMLHASLLSITTCCSNRLNGYEHVTFRHILTGRAKMQSSTLPDLITRSVYNQTIHDQYSI